MKYKEIFMQLAKRRMAAHGKVQLALALAY